MMLLANIVAVVVDTAAAVIPTPAVALIIAIATDISVVVVAVAVAKIIVVTTIVAAMGGDANKLKILTKLFIVSQKVATNVNG